MNEQEQWLNWAVELQALAQAGMYYTKVEFERERYERIREISAEMLSLKTDIPVDKVKELFCAGSGYQTPKLDNRAVIFNDDKILLVQESDGRWALPGGWQDVNLSVKENTVKEVREEAGLEAVAERIIAVQDRDKNNPPPIAVKIVKIFVLCKAIGGSFQPNSETLDSGYFGLDDLPVLSTSKTTEAQIKMCFEAYKDENWVVRVD